MVPKSSGNPLGQAAAQAQRPACRLTLVGTVHRAPSGSKALRRLLEDLRPDYLTLEMSPYALTFRRLHGPRLLGTLQEKLDLLSRQQQRPLAELAGHDQILSIHRLLELPFEYQVAAAYAMERDLSLELIDNSSVSAAKLRRVESELLALSNLEVLVGLPDAETRGDPESLTVARRLIFGSPAPSLLQAYLASRRGPEAIGERDAAMAERLFALCRDLRGKHLVHIGGWVHLLEDERGETLFCRLAAFGAQRRLPDEGPQPEDRRPCPER